MPFDMVDGDERKVVCRGKPFGKIDAYEERADQSGVRRYGDKVNFG